MEKTAFLKYMVTVANKVCDGNALEKMRRKNNVRARMFIAVEMRKKYSLQETAKFLNIDHSSVAYYVKIHPINVLFDKQYAREYYEYDEKVARISDNEPFVLVHLKHRVAYINEELQLLGFDGEKIHNFWEECLNEARQTN